MGVNGQKLNFQEHGRRWRDNGVETAWNSFFSILIIAIASSNNIFVNKRGGGGQGVAHKQAQIGVNGQKLNFQANFGRWRNKGVETAWNSFLFSYQIKFVLHPFFGVSKNFARHMNDLRN